MAKKKKKSKAPERNIDLQSMLLIGFGIVLGVILYISNDGLAGKIISLILGGLIGKLAFAIPIALVFMGIYIIFRDYSRFQLKATLFIALFVAIASLVTCIDFEMIFTSELTGEVEVPSNMFHAIGTICQKGTEFSKTLNSGGGLIGALFSVPIIAVFGGNKLVTIVIDVILIIILTLLITGIAFSSIVIGIKDFFANSYNKGKENLHELKEKHARLMEELEEDEEEEEEPEEIPIRTRASKKSVVASAPTKSKNKKFQQIMEQTEIVGNAKQISLSDLDLDEYEEEPEEQVEETPLIDEEVIEEEEPEEEVPIAPEPPKKKKVLKELYSKAPKDEPKEDNRAEVLNLEHNTVENYDDYVFPPVSLLNEGEPFNEEYSVKELREVASKLQKTLTSFNVDAKVVNVTRGPTVTQYEVQPNVGVKVSKILGLSDDIALNLAAKSIRIEAPIPGKSAVGIEVPNKTKETVWLREVIDSDAFQEAKSKVSFALGKSIDGEPFVSDIAKMPHMLIAGSTGSGKSVCINSILVSLLYKAKPNEVKLILIDPKVVELGVYNGIPHLLIPVVTDPKKAAGALNWAVQEMGARYKLFAAKGVRDIRGYNEALNQEGEDGILPQIVIVVDELADLMMVAPSEVEEAICRLAQMARAAGMHLIIATQRPSVDVVTGIIKANIPSRIAFTVSSQIDSRTILDMAGAEKLLGKGDMLYYPIGESKPIRVQGTFVSDKEIEEIIDFVKANNAEATYNPDVLESFEKANNPPEPESQNGTAPDADELLTDAIELAVQMGNASASMIQRKFKVGYARAGRIIDQMEERGIVSGYDGSKPRQTLISKEEWEEMKEAGVDSVRYEEVDEDEYEEDTSEEEYEEVDDTEEVEEDGEEYYEENGDEESQEEDSDEEYVEDEESEEDDK